MFSVSPAFTGTPTAPTATPGTNTTQIATTAFVTAAVSAAGGGSVTSVQASGGTTGLSFSGGPITSSGTLTLSGTLAVANGGTGVTTSTGTGSVVLSASPTFTGNVGTGDGTLAAPAIRFSADTNTGIFRPGADQIGFSAGGVQALTVTVGGASAPVFEATSVFWTPDGSAAAPSYTFTSDLDTGLFRIGANQLGIATGGTQRIAVSTTAVTSTLPILAPAGTVSAPAVAFSGDSDTGIYNSGAGYVSLASNGVLRAEFGAVNQIVGNLLVNADSVQIGTSQTPANASAAGAQGEIAWDSNYVYVCVANNTWKRVAIATW